VGSTNGAIQAIFGCQPVSSLSHLIAAVVAVVAAGPLVRLGRGNTGRVVALSIYVGCVAGALAISGLYHSVARGCPTRLFMQRLDHYAIWILIAGTFTAVHGIMCKGFWRGGLLSIVWAYALAGVFLQVMWFDLFKGQVGLGLYLGLGWIGFASIIKLGRQLGFQAVLPILYAGVAFSLGGVLEAIGWPAVIVEGVGPHEVFHIAVIVGLAFLWLFIRKLLVHHLPSLALATVAPRSR
jgi:channel protein (hemolysin III family)